jgi:hypothetical protein
MRIARRIVGISAAAFMSLAVAACGDDGPEPPTDMAVGYQTIRLDDISFAGRKRMQVYVVAPEATSRDQLAHTAMQAAVDLYKDKLPQLASATVLDGPEGDYIAVADYAPDQFGIDGKTPLANVTWQIEAIDPPASVTMRAYAPQ